MATASRGRVMLSAEGVGNHMTGYMCSMVRPMPWASGEVRCRGEALESAERVACGGLEGWLMEGVVRRRGIPCGYVCASVSCVGLDAC